jgi:hypothetical protein
MTVVEGQVMTVIIMSSEEFFSPTIVTTVFRAHHKCSKSTGVVFTFYMHTSVAHEDVHVPFSLEKHTRRTSSL